VLQGVAASVGTAHVLLRKDHARSAMGSYRRAMSPAAVLLALVEAEVPWIGGARSSGLSTRTGRCRYPRGTAFLQLPLGGTYVPG
jgi:hypothetical protein